jgi:sigma-B regulation protein RsbU (phosphoserine phosphatase)
MENRHRRTGALGFLSMIPLPHNMFRSPNNVSFNKINMALLLGDLYNGFESGICSGATRFAYENDINLICFIGSELASTTGANARRNDIYDLISVYNVQGIIAITSILTNHIGRKKANDFLHRFAPLPIVSIGVELADTPCVLCDNEKPMRELLVHLIENHSCKRPAFITGRESNPDSQLRLSVYKQVLTEYGIPVDQNLIVPGIFDTNSGKQAVDILLDQRKMDFDAIVAVNDYMAMGALNELLKRGISVPGDVKVVGFDDIVESRFLKVPLTTVRQPIFNLGYNAAKLLLQRVQNADFRQNLVLPAQTVFRKSCGCHLAEEMGTSHELILQKGHVSIHDASEIKQVLVPRILSLIDEKFSIYARSRIKPEWINSILDLLLNALRRKDSTQFIHDIEGIIDKSLDADVDAALWYFIFSYIFNNVLIFLPSSRSSAIGKKLFNSAMDIINNFGMKQHEMTIINNYEQSKKLSEISKSLISVFDLKGLNEILMHELPRFGIRSFYISMFLRDRGNGTKNYARLIFAYEDYKPIDLEQKEIRFIAKELIPGGFKVNASNNYILMPFHFDEEYAGFFVYEVENTSNEKLEILTVQICNTLKVIDLYDKLNNTRTPAPRRISFKYKKSGLSKKKSHEYFQRLIHFMETEKKYIDPDFTPDLLADKIKVSRHNLSHIINEYAGMNFYDFVNSYRIKEIIKYLRTAEQNNEKMIDIAMNYGFKSKSTFNKIFKKHTNMTPTEFKHKISINNGDKDKKLMQVFSRYGFDA